ncbi:MAG: polysaccharide biosynthesis C-terminal domain-containing protein, partial [Anderseniella sp.]|nr:polysaccharide biosynthesis C-terminal domain-containing protein [Anderseniella sp.]
EEFAASNAPLLVLCGSIVISGFFGANATLLNMTGHQARVTRASVLSLVLLGLVAPPFIVMQGVVGAGIATALSTLTWNFLMWRDALRLLGLDTSFMPFLKRAISDV